jgi:hypothetical protein
VTGMLTAINYDDQIRTKGCQTEKVRVYGRKHELKNDPNIFHLTLYREAELSGMISFDDPLNDTQNLFKFSKLSVPQSNRESVLAKVSLNLNPRSSRYHDMFSSTK